MKKNKFNPELLKEEMNRFRVLETYDFYHEDKQAPEFKIEEEDAEQPIPDDNADTTAGAEDQAPETNAGGDDMGSVENDIENDLGLDATADQAPVGDLPEPSAEEVPVEEPVDDGIEIDVTSLVKGTEDAKSSADRAVQTSELVLQKLADMEQKITGMAASAGQLDAKMNNIEHQIVKRNPTPVEKLEMRSFDSFPYNQKLTDFWNEKEGSNYDPMSDTKKKEYVLTQDDVDNSYSESEIENSFDYDEEDIY